MSPPEHILSALVILASSTMGMLIPGYIATAEQEILNSLLLRVDERPAAIGVLFLGGSIAGLILGCLAVIQFERAGKTSRLYLSAVKYFSLSMFCTGAGMLISLLAGGTGAPTPHVRLISFFMVVVDLTAGSAALITMYFRPAFRDVLFGKWRMKRGRE